MSGKEDPRYDSDKSAKDMRMALLAMEKCTHKFIHDHNELSSKAEYLKYKNFVEQRSNIRTQQTDPRYHTSSVTRELQGTLSTLQKTTHNFVRQHNELANRAEYLQYTDFVRQYENKSKTNE